MTTRQMFLTCIAILLACIVLSVAFTAASAAPADVYDPAYTAQCCACEPSDVAEPAPLPRLYLPSVQRSTPPMAAEYDPAQPVATPEPDPPVIGD